MPTLILKLSAPLPAERREKLAAALTQLTTEVLRKRADVTAVLIEELTPAFWTIGAATPTAPTAWLEVSITAGTNTEAQKARFVEAAFEELQRQLAPGEPLAEASYVIVRELPATDWGYGGRTQAARRRQAKEEAKPADPARPSPTGALTLP